MFCSSRPLIAVSSADLNSRCLSVEVTAPLLDRVSVGRIFRTVGKDDNVVRKVRQRGEKADGENECEPKSRRKVEQAFLQTETEKRYKREIKRSKPSRQTARQTAEPSTNDVLDVRGEGDPSERSVGGCIGRRCRILLENLRGLV